MYCRYCGKELPDGERFCTRCGKSQKKNAGKHIDKKNDEDSFMQEGAQFSRAVQAAVVIISIIAIAAGIGAAVYFHSEYMSAEEPEATVAAATAAPTYEQSTDEPEVSEEEIQRVKPFMTAVIDETAGFEAAYPSVFVVETPTGDDIVFQASSEESDATMYISQSAATGTAAQMLREYAEANGGRVIYSKATDTIYTVRIDQGSKSYYRKTIVSGGTALSFEFVCDESVSMQYDEYMRYIAYTLNRTED